MSSSASWPTDAEDRKAKVWQVYLVRCADDSLYCGVTTDPERRVAQHNGKLAGGARYTRSRRPVALVCLCPCRSRSEALRLEAAVKRLPKDRKQAALAKAATGS